ncbi:hypothetical protein ABW21_db0204809 [Orbilia brochopaga]|nr:hypothetical protein ABW21_db0204809 [Drechslerella brochopaga]
MLANTQDRLILMAALCCPLALAAFAPPITANATTNATANATVDATANATVNGTVNGTINGTVNGTIDGTVNGTKSFETTIGAADPCNALHPIPNDTAIYCTSNPLADDGKCSLEPQNTDCASFCEVRRRYFWGKEVPLKASWFNSSNPAMPKSLQLGNRRFIITPAIAISFKCEYALSVFRQSLESLHVEYIYDYNRDESMPEVEASDIQPNCGYFTFIPILTESCGSITRWGRLMQFSSDGNQTEESECFISGSSETFENQCVTYPQLQENGNPSGYTTVGKLHSTYAP